ncbi:MULTISPECIES: hypothetical protein [Thermococcus]|uniref:Uncharacterized protein n=1 Tax=Thermococcus nautili TaxID=195522 RepID=W8PIA0_9EURY|nr:MULTISPECIES: hypothetical protein [Thermococcus]AHL21844.1 hypothetical protein BD01_0215 [Thermococcus nautili]NJE48916.1 hypothetical protein [Thermococcus sp. 9N3]CAI1491836.1 conserved protein of unknown function [Thermococcus nautili]
MSDVFELARRYHDELGIKEPSLATMAAEFFDDLGLKMADFLRKEGYNIVGTKFIDYDKSLVMDVTKGDKGFEITLRKS